VPHRHRRDLQPAHLPRLLSHLGERELGRDPLESDREERRREVHREQLAQRAADRPRSPDADDALGVEERREEAEPLDVVEMQMREDEVELPDLLCGQRSAERADARPGIEDDDRA